jgi:hemerythrin superfamily protein
MKGRRGMNAIEMLKKEHRAVEGLFTKFESAKSADSRRTVFEQIADALAVHATIEEKHFYPAVKAKATEDILLEAVEEHLEIKRIIADLLALDASNETFEAKVTVLKEDVEHHVEEEEKVLFPKVQKIFEEEELETIAAAMEQTEGELLETGRPRDAVPSEIDSAAHV